MEPGRSKALALLWLLAALTLASCAPAKQAIQSPVPLPESFSATGRAELPEKWWLSFADPALDGFIERALAGNLSLKSTWDRLRQTEAIQRKAGAEHVPSLDAEASAFSSRSRQNGATGTGRDFGLGLVAGYEIDLWGRIRAGRNAAILDTRASAEDLRAAALTLSAQVAGTWYQLVEQYGQLELLDRQVETNRKVLELVTLRFRTGQTGIADVLQQRQLVESNIGERTQVESRARVLENQLSILVGIPPGQLQPPPVTDLIQLPSLPATGIPAALVQSRPDVRSAWYGVLSADQSTAVAVADRFPRLSFAAGISTGGEHADQLFDNWLASLAANLAAPLVDGGLRKAEVDRSRAVTEERLHAYGQTVLEALGEVEDALAREARQHEYLLSLKRQLALAQSVIDRVRDHYLNGAENYQRVLDALLTYQQLQRNYLNGQRVLIQYRIDLCRALGGGWQLLPEDREPSPPDKANAS